MMRFGALLVALAGCNGLLGVHDFAPLDATGGDDVPASQAGTSLVAFGFEKSHNANLVHDLAGTIGDETADVYGFGLSASQLAPTFTTDGAAVEVAGVAQVSGVTAQDFTHPVAYDVIADSGKRASYLITLHDRALVAAGSVAISSSIRARAMSFGDLDGDHRAEMVLIDQARDSVQIFTTQGPAPFSLQLAVTLDGSSTFTALALADLDGDGKLDIVATTTSGVATWTNNSHAGAFSFQPNQQLLVGGSGIVAVVAADFNGDSLADLAIAVGGSSQQLVIGRNTTLAAGSPSFDLSTHILLAAAPVALVATDCDHDARRDLVVALANQSIQPLANTGSAFTLLPKLTLAPDGAAAGLQLADVNNDGNADLIVPYSGVAAFGVLLHDGSSGFLAPTTIATTAVASAMAMGDLDGDHRADALLVTTVGSKIRLEPWLSASTATAAAFGATAPIELSYPAIVGAPDLDNDNFADAVVATSTSVSGPAISLFQNR